MCWPFADVDVDVDDDDDDGDVEGDCDCDVCRLKSSVVLWSVRVCDCVRVCSGQVTWLVLAYKCTSVEFQVQSKEAQVSADFRSSVDSQLTTHNSRHSTLLFYFISSNDRQTNR